MRQRGHDATGAGAGDPQADLVADRGRAADPVVLDETLLIGSGRYDDVRPEAPDLEASPRIQRAEAIDGRSGQQVHDGDIEERPRRQLEVGHRILEVKAFHIRPVLLGRRARRLAPLPRFRERDLAAEGSGQDLRQVGLVAGHRSPIGKRQADGGQFQSRLRRLDVGGAEVEEGPPLPRILSARDLSGRRVHNRELAVA